MLFIHKTSASVFCAICSKLNLTVRDLLTKRSETPHENSEKEDFLYSSLALKFLDVGLYIGHKNNLFLNVNKPSIILPYCLAATLLIAYECIYKNNLTFWCVRYFTSNKIL